MMRYIDLMGGQKPHLLIKTVNNLGAETVVQYAPSTKFYLQAKLAGKPWITKLPFPVHVVERVETYDHISRNHFVTRYAYHHGYFDGVEREFRGFGMVEQWDTEEFTVLSAGDVPATNIDVTSHVPPVLTRTWFHTGVYVDRDRISNFFADRPPELDGYYRELGLTPEQVQQLLLDDTVLPDSLTVEEEREACRALKGAMLRQEIYALDGTEKQKHPYTVSEQNYSIEQLQPRSNNKHAVFFTHPRESITYHYERKLDENNQADPRVVHEMVLEVDRFGNVLKSVAIAYPRRTPAHPEQGKTLITYTENQVTNKPNEATWYRIGVPIETRTYELTGYTNTGGRFQHSDFVQPDPNNLDVLVHIFDREIDYEDEPTNGKQRRLIERVRSLYRPNSQANTTDPTCLLLGEVESLALPCESFKLAFTPGLLTQVYNSKIGSSELDALLSNESKYVQQDGNGNWWIPSGQQAFDPNQFYLAIATKDPFGKAFTTTYDAHKLLVIRTADPLQNVVQIENDYRVMQPKRLIDQNQNHAVVEFDILGMVAGTAVLGKVDAAGRSESGDSLEGFVADLSKQQLQDFLRSPRTVAAGLLGNATTRIIYDLECFQRSGQPLFAATIARENHVNSPNGNPSPVQVSLSYSDGFGREVQKKIEAEPGNTLTDPRWVGNGRTIFNNKGKPVKQYEPFFSSTHLYEDEPEMVMTGVTLILFYDPLERVVATLHPNHTYEKVVFDPWTQKTWDVNDTVALEDPKNDLDVGSFFKRLPDVDYLPTWFTRAQASASTAERDAANKALAHANTPTIAHFDTLGRPFLTIADNGTDGKYETHVKLDIEGNQREVTDARGNRVMQHEFDLLGHVIHSQSMDAGDRWMLNNVAGHPIRIWDSLKHQIHHQYDELQRPTHLFVQKEGEQELLAERIVYGEKITNATNLNLRGKALMQFDAAGVVTNLGQNPQTNQDEAYDFKGNLLRSSRRLLLWNQQNKQQVNWSAFESLFAIVPPATLDMVAIQTALTPLLEADIFTASTTFDALNRPTTMTTPDRSVFQPVYNEANLLEQVRVNLRGSQVETLFVKNIDYNEKGQRTLIEYGKDAANDEVVKTEYRYDRKTFRLTNLKTIRKLDGVVLQNLSYTYDPVGNITEIQDKAQQTIFFRNAQVEPVNRYKYDPIYRLIEATGREHIGQALNPSEYKSEYKPAYDYNHSTRVNQPHPNDIQAMRDYTEEYKYDSVGNILNFIHNVSSGKLWERRYNYDANSNRLLSTNVPGIPNQPELLVNYEYDEHGNMIKMPHLTEMQWDYGDRLQMTQQQVVNNGGTAERTYYIYDASGQRVRKVTERQAAAGQTPTKKNERIYLGGYEIYHEYNGNGTTVTLERQTLHIMDDTQRIALVETKTIGGNDGTPLLVPVIRYQLNNHLGSACVELDKNGKEISYEEYYPYGSTSYQGTSGVAEVSRKRYRYTGKERDEETGLYYHGARYYASWLGRWASCDPAGMSDGSNLYKFVRNNPINFIDKTGNEPAPAVSPPSTLSALERAREAWGSAELIQGGEVAAAPKPPPVSLGGIGAAGVVLLVVLIVLSDPPASTQQDWMDTYGYPSPMVSGQSFSEKPAQEILICHNCRSKSTQGT